MSPLIATQDLTVGYNNVPLISGLNLTLQGGSLVAFIGHNGAGKSTILRTLTGELKPVSGKVLVKGKELGQWDRSCLATEISIVTTDSVTAGALTVRELVALGRHPYTGIFGRLSEQDNLAVDNAMRLVGISHFADRYVASLSDGERQKTMIARALSQDTPAIILDEPFSFLDVAARVEILSILKSLAHNQKKAILFSSHDIAQTLRMADFIWMLTPKRELIQGSPEYLKSSGLIQNLFDNDCVTFDLTQNDFIAK